MTKQRIDDSTVSREHVTERPQYLYHAVRLGKGKPEVLARRVSGINKHGLRRHRSRHRVSERDHEPLIFFFETSLSAEIYAAGGLIYEVTLPAAAPLYRDPALGAVGAVYTTVDIPCACLRVLTSNELIALSQQQH